MFRFTVFLFISILHGSVLISSELPEQKEIKNYYYYSKSNKNSFSSQFIFGKDEKHEPVLFFIPNKKTFPQYYIPWCDGHAEGCWNSEGRWVGGRETLTSPGKTGFLSSNENSLFDIYTNLFTLCMIFIVLNAIIQIIYRVKLSNVLLFLVRTIANGTCTKVIILLLLLIWSIKKILIFMFYLFSGDKCSKLSRLLILLVVLNIAILIIYPASPSEILLFLVKIIGSGMFLKILFFYFCYFPISNNY